MTDPDTTPDLDADADDTSTTTTPMLGVVAPVLPLPPAMADTAVRHAAEWVEAELRRLREERAERDASGLAEIEEMRQRLIDDRARTNASIKLLVAEQARLRRLIRVLDAT